MERPAGWPIGGPTHVQPPGDRGEGLETALGFLVGLAQRGALTLMARPDVERALQDVAEAKRQLEILVLRECRRLRTGADP